MRRLLGDHRRDGVFEDQLFLVVGFQNQRVFVETLDSARELHAAHQVNGENYFVLAGVVQEAILNILSRFIHAIPQPFRESKTGVTNGLINCTIIILPEWGTAERRKGSAIRRRVRHAPPWRKGKAW